MSRLVEQRKNLMKEGIYEAAVAVLIRDGLEATTMERVAEEAGVAKGSLYNYFENKTDLLEFVHERTIEPLRQGVREAIEERRRQPALGDDPSARNRRGRLPGG